jgi:hypothetical protein
MEIEMAGKDKSVLFYRNPYEDSYKLTFESLTEEEVLALVHALMIARTVSPVAKDLSKYLGRGLAIASELWPLSCPNKAQELAEALAGDLETVLKTMAETRVRQFAQLLALTSSAEKQ